MYLYIIAYDKMNNLRTIFKSPQIMFLNYQEITTEINVLKYIVNLKFFYVEFGFNDLMINHFGQKINKIAYEIVCNVVKFINLTIYA